MHSLKMASGTSIISSQLSKNVTFSDFITFFHKLSHENLSIEDIKFTMKKRSLIQHICNNLHYHLLKEIINGYLKGY